jgi:hypothetical protein
MAQPIAQDEHDLALQPARAGTTAPRAFIAEQSVGSLLRNTVALYRSNFRALALAYALPTFPVLLLQQVAQANQNTGLFVATALVGTVVSFFAVGALTVIISDICLGNVPRVSRAYARILKGGLWWRLLWTSILQMILWTVGLVLLLIPGIILMIRMVVCSTVVILEGDSGVKAIKRSMSLTKGHFWRLFAVLAVLGLLTFALFFIAMLPIGIGLALLASSLGESELQMVIGILLAPLMQGVLYPMVFIAFVLLYYDLRVRKESYDVEALAEDMMR